MRKTKVIYALIASAMLSMAVVGCGSSETIDNDMSVESTTPVPTDAVGLGGVVDSDDVTPTSEPTATSTPVPTETPTPEPTATSTPVPTETPTPEPTATSTPVPTATPTPEPTATSTPVPTATPTPEPTATSTPVPTVTPTQESNNAFADVEVLGLGNYFDITYPRYDNGQLVEELISVSFDEVTLVDGRIRYTFQTNWSEHKDFCVTVVDKNTGIEFAEAGTTINPLVCSDPSITLADGTVVEFTITAFSSWNDWDLNHTDKMIFVPAEYDDFLFVWKVYDEVGNAVPYKYFGLE